MTFVSADVAVQQIEETVYTPGPTLYRLLKEVIYKDGDTEYRVPENYVTDFASVPRCISWFAPNSGQYNPAAIIHDYLITDVLEKEHAIESNHVDEIFRLAMQELRVPWYRRWVMWTGVRWGALFNGRRRAGWHKEMFKTLAATLLALPLIVPSLTVQVTIWLGMLVSLFLPNRAKISAQKT
jgi:uncharacterized protein DUF1353